MTTQTKNQNEVVELANGPFVAAMVAMGLGCFTLGLATIMAEASPAVKTFLNLYNPVGPLSGKTIAATAVYFISWGILAIALRGKNVNLKAWMTFALVLTGLSFLMTFPLFYQLFVAK